MEDAYTEEELAELRRQLRVHGDAAMKEVVRQGVTLHPRIAAANEELRIAVVFRGDVEMPRGKSEVQFGHAIAMLMHSDRDAFGDYLDGLQLKLSLEVDNEDDLSRILDKAKARHIPAVKVIDAGRTVFGEPTLTCVGVGPMNKTDCNAITRGARMRL